ncbi:MAG: thermonuclease family protein [Patescibacteria group bacterium]|nr:thermonuclease family protein [Patescibacteria group bacterium]
MRRFLTTLVVAVAFVAPTAVLAAGPDMSYVGQILIDAGRHGEAYYISPATSQRVYLGRPAEALERLTRRAVLMQFSDIEKIPLEGQTAGDAAFAATQAGRVLLPNDLLGAAWYVRPILVYRFRLATPGDALLIMRAGTPVSSSVIDRIPLEPGDAVPPPTGEHKITSVEAADTVKLDDGSTVRLIGVDVPSNPDLQESAKARIQAVAGENSCSVQGDFTDQAADGAKLRWLVCGEVNLNSDLVRKGLAFHNVGAPNLKYAEQMIVAGLDALRDKKGFWNK